MKRMIFAALLGAAMMLTPSLASAHDYNRHDSDHPLRIVAYALHPIGILCEYAVLRPIHWAVSYNKNTQVIFGHEVQKGEPADKFEWVLD